jgi:hypothetical protein
VLAGVGHVQAPADCRETGAVVPLYE